MIWCSPEASGRSTARNATRKQRLNCAMFWLSVSRYACITMVSLDWSFVTESSSEKRLSPRYSNLAFYDLWQYRPRFQQNNQTLRRPSNSSPNKMTSLKFVNISHNAVGCSSYFSWFQFIPRRYGRPSPQKKTRMSNRSVNKKLVYGSAAG